MLENYILLCDVPASSDISMLDNGTTTIVSSFRAKAESYALLVILSVIWGFAFVAIRYLDFELSFVDLTLLRWVVASASYLALLPFVGRMKTRFESRDLPRLLVVAFSTWPPIILPLIMPRKLYLLVWRVC